jgi:hypothetical protein
MRERICPISGPGSLSKTVRERRAREIITNSGADTVEYFNRSDQFCGTCSFLSASLAWQLKP